MATHDDMKVADLRSGVGTLFMMNQILECLHNVRKINKMENKNE